jgi:hypothetical protein
MDQYIRSMLSRITLAPDHPSDQYRSGWLGDWVCERIMPRPDGTVLQLKAVAPHRPDAAALDAREELEAFQRYCDDLDDIFRHAGTKDLQGIRIPFYLNGIIRLQLGDMLRFLVALGERHLLQAQRIWASGQPAENRPSPRSH